jgi:hypothetical protein
MTCSLGFSFRCNVTNASAVTNEWLQGSKLGRTSRNKKNQEMMSSVYKDLDFVDMKRKIRLQPPEAEDLRAQLRTDSAYLAKHDIIDYSFLVGIHHLQGGETSESHKREWLTKNFHNLEEMYTSFKKECTSKTVVLTEDEGQGQQIGVEKSKYFAYFTWDDFVELAYTNHVSLCLKERLFFCLR